MNTTKHVLNIGSVTVDLNERVKREEKDRVTYTSRRIGVRHAELELTIDLNKLIYLGKRAASSKGLRAGIAHGGVVIKVKDFEDRINGALET